MFTGRLTERYTKSGSLQTLSAISFFAEKIVEDSRTKLEKHASRRRDDFEAFQFYFLSFLGSKSSAQTGLSLFALACSP